MLKSREMAIEVPIHPDLVWDYDPPPSDPLWRLQRIGESFPFYGRDRLTIRLLYQHRDQLDLPSEITRLIELYYEYLTDEPAH